MADHPAGRAGRAPELSLVYADPQGRPRVFSIPEGTTTLGRARDNDLVLDDPTVTAHHVVLMRDGERLELRDLFSGETLVNEARRRNGALVPGDVLSLGQVRLRVMKVAPRRAPPSATARGQTDRLERIEPRTQRMHRPAAARDGGPTIAASPSPQGGEVALRGAARVGHASAEGADAPVARGSGRPGGDHGGLGVAGESHAEPAPSQARRDPRALRPATEVGSRAAARATPSGAAGREATVALPRPEIPEEPPTPERPAATVPLARPAEPAAASDELRALQEREARRERQLQRARQLSDEMLLEDDFEVILEQVAMAFLDVFAADRAVTVLFEEDGRNPLLTVERRRDGTDDGTGVAQEIVDRCLQVRSVIKIAGGHQGLGGLAAPLLSKGKAVGLLYFERTTAAGQALDAADVHLMAMLTNQAAVVIAPLVGG
ncbi:MAG: FHA domain-containing protein [Planctomycetes bacterium]|nr:FHA domain-containing protein [Planctomycetota bacterium]